jgi:hypothetical protein
MCVMDELGPQMKNLEPQTNFRQFRRGKNDKRGERRKCNHHVVR